MVRTQRPGFILAYPLLFGATPALIALALLRVLFGSMDLVDDAGILIGARLWLGWILLGATHQPRGPWRLVSQVFGGEMLMLAASLKAMVSREVMYSPDYILVAIRQRMETFEPSGPEPDLCQPEERPDRPVA